jgi:monoamine oxidase
LKSAVNTEHKLVKAATVDSEIELVFDAAEGEVKVTCDRVVFALPFSTLRTVNLDGLELTEEKRTIIADLGYGTNAKIMGGFSRRTWTEAGANGSLTSDTELQQTWDSSVGQAGESGILTNFVGGDRGVAAGEGSEDAWFRGLLDELEAIFPGTKEAYIPDSAVRMHWPSQVHTRGSYTCYKPGQWAFWGVEGLPEGKLHFCGEHTSPEFQGWMEGAAETGGRVAAEILNDLGVAFPNGLAAVLDDVTALPGQMLRSSRFARRWLRVQASRVAAAHRG